jgi:hypothetical protein
MGAEILPERTHMGLQRTIDDNKMSSKSGAELIVSLDMAKPPTREIEFLEFPRVIYKHPKEPFVKIEHRNNMKELVFTELVPAEHLTRIVNSKAELEKAMKDGWVKDPYVPQAAPSSTDANY